MVDGGPITEDWRHLVLSIRDRFMSPLTKISNQPSTLSQDISQGNILAGSVVFITCENKHALSYLLRVRTNMLSYLFKRFLIPSLGKSSDLPLTILYLLHCILWLSQYRNWTFTLKINSSENINRQLQSYDNALNILLDLICIGICLLAFPPNFTTE